MNDGNDTIPAPEDPQPEGKTVSFEEMWLIHEKMLISPSVSPRARFELKKTFFAGLHSTLQTAAYIIDNCKTDEAVKRLTALREELEEVVAELLKQEAMFTATDHRVLEAGDWKENVAHVCAKAIHDKIGCQTAVQMRPTVEDIKIVIERALIRNKA